MIPKSLARGPAAEVDGRGTPRSGGGGGHDPNAGRRRRIRFEPACGGLDGAVARLCGILAEAQFEGTRQRMKICGAPNCGAAFFDDSKNHSRKWCSSKCCSRATSSAFRRRNLEEERKRERLGVYNRTRAHTSAVLHEVAKGLSRR